MVYRPFEKPGQDWMVRGLAGLDFSQEDFDEEFLGISQFTMGAIKREELLEMRWDQYEKFLARIIEMSEEMKNKNG